MERNIDIYASKLGDDKLGMYMTKTKLADWKG
jgi:hypothetical protein